MDIESFFNHLFCVWVGWYLAKERYSNKIKKEKESHRTLAVQTLYLNGKGKISDEEFNTYERVDKKINELVNANLQWFQSKVVTDIRD